MTLRATLSRRLALSAALAALGGAGCRERPDAAAAPPATPHLLPTGRALDPAGRTIDVGNMPLAVAVAPSGLGKMPGLWE